MKSYDKMTKKELIEQIERLEGIIADLRHDNDALFKERCNKMSEIVRLRRQVEALQLCPPEKNYAKNTKTKNIRV